jgi:hypothetical protein
MIDVLMPVDNNAQTLDETIRSVVPRSIVAESAVAADRHLQPSRERLHG